ncbi:MAG: HD domain-containing protein [Deltaproteobacteria bacterium]|nr:HD domain-containing protein [Deltaproteobacteria bacterium]MBW2051867.1 HD domain-containing protein [Deltaproteobacteria bacterium]
MERNLINTLWERFQALSWFPVFTEAIRDSKQPLFVVGGAVRDLILGREFDDLDIVAAGPLDETVQKLSLNLGVRAIPLGRFPKQVFRFVLPDLIIDLAPLEGDTIKTELARRDLTINAMALEFKPDQDQTEIIDPWGGLSDLREKKARFVSEAVILSDPLRLLRLFRFSAVLDLIPHPSSLALVIKHAPLIKKVAGERIREELLKLLAVPSSHATIKIMMEHGLLTALIPEIKSLRGSLQNVYHHLDVLDHTFLAFYYLEQIMAAPEKHFAAFDSKIRAYLSYGDRPALLKLAILLHDLGKPAARSEDKEGRIHFYKHEVIGAETAIRIVHRFRFSRAEENYIRFIIRHHLQPFHLLTSEASGKLRPKGIYRFGRLAGPDLWGLLIHALADAMATQGPASKDHRSIPGLLAFFDRLILEIAKQRDRNPKLLTGTDLITSFGLPSSPLIGRLLLSVEEAHATGQIKNKSEALTFVAELLEKNDNPNKLSIY